MTAEEFKKLAIPFSRKLYPMVFRVLRNEEETRDALQDIMVKLWSKREELASCSNLEAYMVTVAKNHSFDLLKKKRPVLLNEKESFRAGNLEADFDGPESAEKYELLKKCIENLPDKYRTVLQMRDIDGFSFEEIKAFTGLEVPNLRVVLSRARLKVKEKMEKIYDYDETRRVAP